MFGRKHLSWSLVAALAALALLVAFGHELASTQQKSRNDVTARVRERATLATALIDSLLASSAQQVRARATTYGTPTVSARTLDAARGASTYVALLDSSGRVLAHSRGFTAQAQSDLRESAAVALVRAGHPLGLGNILPYGSTGVINFAVAVPTPLGTRIVLTGIAPASLSAFLQADLLKIPSVKGTYSYLVDANDAVIASTNPARRSGYVFRGASQIKALSQTSGQVNGRYHVQVRFADSTWRLVLSSPAKALFATVSGLRKWVPWLILLGFALTTAAAFALARRALRTRDHVRDANAQLALLNGELEETNAALARRAAELARSNDELDQFASIASHDLQEPLRKVRTFTQQLTLIESDRLSEKGRDYLLRTNAAAERMQQLIEDLLRFSRVATQTRPFAPVSLAEVTSEVLEDLEHEVERCRAIVRVGELPVINGDPSQLRQLMQNLLSNALKFRREGVVPEITVDSAVLGDTCTISVRDNGIGFDPRYEERIFRVFERLHGRSEYPGTGIGLALCRKIAERHGGTIVAHGELGVGSSFIIALPIDQREEVIVIRPFDDVVAVPEGPVRA